MLLQIALECLETVKERDVCGASPVWRLESARQLTKLSYSMIGGFVLLHHDEYRMRYRPKARVVRRIGHDHLLIHLGYEWEQHLLFLLDVSKHVSTQIFDQAR